MSTDRFENSMKEEITALLQLASKRGLQSLVIGGNALILLGYVRNTVDFDLLVRETSRSQWLDLLRELGYRLLRGTTAFAQFEPPTHATTPVDLMFVDDETWQKLNADASTTDLGGEIAHMPRPEHLVALKLHAASSKTRSNPEIDWNDIREIIQICDLNASDAPFRELILRYGGEDALAKIRSFQKS